MEFKGVVCDDGSASRSPDGIATHGVSPVFARHNIIANTNYRAGAPDYISAFGVQFLAYGFFCGVGIYPANKIRLTTYFPGQKAGARRKLQSGCV